MNNQVSVAIAFSPISLNNTDVTHKPEAEA